MNGKVVGRIFRLIRMIHKQQKHPANERWYHWRSQLKFNLYYCAHRTVSTSITLPTQHSVYQGSKQEMEVRCGKRRGRKYASLSKSCGSFQDGKWLNACRVQHYVELVYDYSIITTRSHPTQVIDKKRSHCTEMDANKEWRFIVEVY